MLEAKDVDQLPRHGIEGITVDKVLVVLHILPIC